MSLRRAWERMLRRIRRLETVAETSNSDVAPASDKHVAAASNNNVAPAFSTVENTQEASGLPHRETAAETSSKHVAPTFGTSNDARPNQGASGLVLLEATAETSNNDVAPALGTLQHIGPSQEAHRDMAAETSETDDVVPAFGTTGDTDQEAFGLLQSETAAGTSKPNDIVPASSTMDNTGPDQEASALLRLPAEIRNAIYGYALAEDEIAVTAGLQQPPLLHICRQVRVEALGLWYTSNDFVIPIEDCDATLLVAFVGHLRLVGHAGVDLPVMLGGKNWSNLQRWCRAIWSQQCVHHLPRYAEATEVEAVIIAAHDIAAQYVNEPWESCEQALENLGFVVGKFDSEWLPNEQSRK
ncbi:hypothetical protein LTR85_005580 [Meristemomyces frigidus]|nr:hypothetical protein LTR85_005580 [Meristemomyces frigidus]